MVNPKRCFFAHLSVSDLSPLMSADSAVLSASVVLW